MGLYLQKERDGERDGGEEDVSFLWVGKISQRRDGLPTPVFLSFPAGLDGEEPACNAGDLGSILGLGRSPGGWMATQSNILRCTLRGNGRLSFDERRVESSCSPNSTTWGPGHAIGEGLHLLLVLPQVMVQLRTSEGLAILSGGLGDQTTRGQ